MFKWLDKIIDNILKYNNVKIARAILLFYLLFLLLPLLLTYWPWPMVDFTNTGQIGDTIGGITAPFIGIIAGVLTFFAFHEQYRSNITAKNDLTKERFENKFYNFLNLLNNLEINTSIPNVGNYKQPFHFMLYEYKAIAVLIYRKYGKPNLECRDPNSIQHDRFFSDDMREKIMKEAFVIFINGVSGSSTNRLTEYISSSENLNDYFLHIQKYYANPEHNSVPYLDDYETCKIKLFDGHRLRMVPFYRLVCKILELVYEGGGDDKELYLSTLLSILSEHQLALLKLMYIYDSNEHERFILSHNSEIRSFFMDSYDAIQTNNKVCISKYIFSKVMDCTKKEFINFRSKVGEFSLL